MCLFLHHSLSLHPSLFFSFLLSLSFPHSLLHYSFHALEIANTTPNATATMTPWQPYVFACEAEAILSSITFKRTHPTDASTTRDDVESTDVDQTDCNDLEVDVSGSMTVVDEWLFSARALREYVWYRCDGLLQRVGIHLLLDSALPKSWHSGEWCTV